MRGVMGVCGLFVSVALFPLLHHCVSGTAIMGTPPPAGVVKLTRYGAFEGSKLDTVEDPDIGTNCHETRLHLLKEKDVVKKERARLAYTITPFEVVPTNTSVRFCYHNFVLDSFQLLMNYLRPPLSFIAPKTDLYLGKNDQSIYGHRNASFVTSSEFTFVTPQNPLYHQHTGFVLHPIEGRPYFKMRGKLVPNFDDRPVAEVQRVSWSVHYSQMGDPSKALLIQEGSFDVFPIDDNKGRVSEGSKDEIDVTIHGFEDGWVAFVMSVEHIVNGTKLPEEDLGRLQIDDSGVEYLFMEAADPTKYTNYTGEKKTNSTWWRSVEERAAADLPPPLGPPPITPSNDAVGTFDFSTDAVWSTLNNQVNVVSLADGCDAVDDDVYQAALIQGKEGGGMRFQKGAGVAITGISDVINTGDHTQFTIAMMARFDRTACHTRLLNTNPENDNGIYLCDGIQLVPEPAAGDPLAAMKWYHIAISTDSSRRTKIYVDGVLEKEWDATKYAWTTGMKIEGDSIYLFNDCGACPCDNDEGTSGWISHLVVYNSLVEDSVIKTLYESLGNGIIAHYDLTTRTLQNFKGNAGFLEDLGTSCGVPNQFVSVTGNHGKNKTVLRVTKGTGVRMAGVGNSLLQSGSDTQYTILMNVRLHSTACHGRLFGTQVPNDNGIFVCDDMRLFPLLRDGFSGNELTTEKFQTFAITTKLDGGVGKTQLFIDGHLSKTWESTQEEWDTSVSLTDSDIVFFNDAQGVCETEEDTKHLGVDLAHLAVYSRVLSFTEIQQATQSFGIGTGSYVKHAGLKVSEDNIVGACRGGIAGCTKQCDAIFDCVGFLLEGGATGVETDVGSLISVFSPITDSSRDMYCKSSAGPVYDLDLSRQTLDTPHGVKRSLVDRNRIGRSQVHMKDAASVGTGCTAGSFQEQDMGRGYWAYHDDWISAGTVTTSNQISCNANGLNGIAQAVSPGTFWRMRVYTDINGKIDYFMGKDDGAGGTFGICETLSSSSKHIWSPSADGEYHEAADVGDYYGGTAYHHWPPTASNNGYWGQSFKVDLLIPSFVGLFPQHVHHFQRGTGLYLDTVNDFIPTQQYTTYSFAMLVSLGEVGGCRRIFNVATNGDSGLFVCDGKLLLKVAGGTEVTGVRTMDPDRWYRISLTTSHTRETKVYLNGVVEISETFNNADWGAMLKIENNYISLFNNGGASATCSATTNTEGSIARFLLYDRLLDAEEIRFVSESLRVKCPGVPSECTSHGDCSEGVCGCHRTEAEEYDACRHQAVGTTEGGCNSKSLCGDPLFCEYCDFCPTTRLCSAGAALKICYEHSETLVFTNQVPVTVIDVGTCISGFAAAGFADVKSFCAYKCSLDTDCSAFHLPGDGTCCLKGSFDDSTLTSQAGEFYTQLCNPGVDLCAATQDKRTGANDQEKCESMHNCHYDTSAQTCQTREPEPVFPVGWKTHDCSVAACPGTPECFGQGTCASTPELAAKHAVPEGHCVCWESPDKTRAQFKGVSPESAHNECSLRRCPGDSPLTLWEWNECSGHGNCHACVGECECEDGYRGTVREGSGWGWDCSVRRCPGDRLFLPAKVTGTKTVGTTYINSLSGLDLNGYMVYMVNIGGSASGRWTADNVAGFSVSAGNSDSSWGTVFDFGDASLNHVAKSIRWGSRIDISMSVQQGKYYKVQLLSIERCCSRGSDIYVNGNKVGNFAPYHVTGGTSSANAIFSHSFVATSGTATVSMIGAHHPDTNPTLSAVTLKLMDFKVVEVPGSEAMRVQVFGSHAGAEPQWGSVCKSGFGNSAASVICGSLGLGSGTAVTVTGGSGPFWIDSCSCGGTYYDLTECCLSDHHSTCDHGNEAGVICSQSFNDALYEECSGEGSCTNGVCSCRSNYRGATNDPAEIDCSIMGCPGDTLVDGVWVPCSGHGLCDEQLRTCSCDSGYHWTACERKDCPSTTWNNGVPTYCNGKGTCNFNTGACQCNTGWNGLGCTQTVWVDLTLHNSHFEQSSGNPFFSKPRYRYFQEEGVCKFEGTVLRGSTSDHMASMDGSHECANVGQLIFKSNGGLLTDYSDTVQDRIDIHGRHLYWKQDGSGKVWTSLESLIYIPTSRRSESFDSWGGGWSVYGGGWETPHYNLSPDGTICSLGGLVNHNTGNSDRRIFTLPSECRPRGRLIFSVLECCRYNQARVDVLSDGQVLVQSTRHSTWYHVDWLSVSGIVFPTAQATSSLALVDIANYGSSYLAPSMFVSTNLCVLNGLGNGSPETTIVDLSSSPCKPTDNHIYDQNQNQQRVRVDVDGTHIYYASPNQQTSSWLPFDGIVLTKS